MTLCVLHATFLKYSETPTPFMRTPRYYDQNLMAQRWSDFKTGFHYNRGRTEFESMITKHVWVLIEGRF